MDDNVSPTLFYSCQLPDDRAASVSSKVSSAGNPVFSIKAFIERRVAENRAT